MPLILDTVHLLKFSKPNVSKTDSRSDCFTEQEKKSDFLLNMMLGVLARNRSKLAQPVSCKFTLFIIRDH
jgi:hypothetical protein